MDGEDERGDDVDGPDRHPLGQGVTEALLLAQPIDLDGGLDIEVDGVPHHVRLERIHLEEDTARLLHREEPGGEEPVHSGMIRRPGSG